MLAALDFETLSYVWGVGVIPYKIQINGKEFYITRNLHTAHKELRLPDHERCLWVEAVFLNQSDNAEKGFQVQMMRDIYAKAEQTLVWLGKGTKSTKPTFDFVARFNDASVNDPDTLWQERDRNPLIKGIGKEFNNILECEWWERAWIVQEVVVGQRVIVQRRLHQVERECLYNLLAYPRVRTMPRLSSPKMFN